MPNGGSSGPNQRKHGRLRVEGLTCDRGRILDLSISGVRLRTRSAWGPGETRQVTLRSAGASLSAPAKCVWSRREGLFTWTLGLSFEEASPEQLRAVGELALVYAARLEAARAA